MAFIHIQTTRSSGHHLTHVSALVQNGTSPSTAVLVSTIHQPRARLACTLHKRRKSVRTRIAMHTMIRQVHSSFLKVEALRSSFALLAEARIFWLLLVIKCVNWHRLVTSPETLWI